MIGHSGEWVLDMEKWMAYTRGLQVFGHGKPETGTENSSITGYITDSFSHPISSPCALSPEKLNS